MKKILLLLFSLSLLDVYAQNDDYPTDIPSTYTNPGGKHRITIAKNLLNNSLLIKSNDNCAIQIVVKDSFGNIVDCEERTLLAYGNTIIIPNEYLDDNHSVEIYQDNTLIYNSKTENSELFF